MKTITCWKLALVVVASLILAGCIFRGPVKSSSDVSGRVSGDWQLFMDDYWIEKTNGLTPVLHQPKKHPDNPLIRGDDPWAINPYCYGSVIYDEDEEVFKFWYMSYNYGLPLKYKTPILYATSRDGLSWKRPSLGLHEFKESKKNNILLNHYGHHDLYSPSVIEDPLDPDPTRRYKMMWWDFPLGSKGYQDDGMCVAFSEDGIHWNKHPGNPVLHAKKTERSISDVMMVMYDNRSRKYVAYTKGWADPWPAFRQIVRTESTNFVDWSEPEVVVRHAHDARDPQSYGMLVSQYESVYVGLLASYKKPGNETIDMQLTVSHDNHQWSRVADQATFLPLGPDGSWDDGMLFTAPLIRHNGRILIYYSGWDGPHNTAKRRGAIGLATLRKDGFVSLDAGVRAGSLLTRPIHGAAGPLLINGVATDGSIRVEVLGADGKPFHGYSMGECEAMMEDSVSHRVHWGLLNRLPETDEPIQLLFQLRNASLYSFHAGPVQR